MGGVIIVIIAVLMNVVVRKVAAVALELTGLDRRTADFQALSALTGTGFTTREAEGVLSDPRRRRIISILMIVSNAGMVAVIAGVVSSVVTIASPWAVLRFVILVIALYLIFRLATHTRWARYFSKKIESKLKERFQLDKRTIDRILDLGEDYGIAEITLQESSSAVGKTLASSELGKKDILVLAIERTDEKVLVPKGNNKLHAGDNLICYGRFKEMQELS